MKRWNDNQFPTTQWTLIARLKSEDAEESRKALDELCIQYHYPLYCYIRWRGLNHHDAQDALHDFLAKLLRLEALKTADVEKGRLRTFLATALQRFLINRHRDAHPRRKEVSIDADVEEKFQLEEFSDDLTPDKVLERTWAATVLRTVLADLGAEEAAAGRTAAFKVLVPFLSPDSVNADYAVAAQTLGQSEAALRQALKRLRDKFRSHLRRRVAETLGRPTPEEIDEELKALRSMLTW